MNPEPVLSVDALQALAADPEFARLAAGPFAFVVFADSLEPTIRTTEHEYEEYH